MVSGLVAPLLHLEGGATPRSGPALGRPRALASLIGTRTAGLIHMPQTTFVRGRADKRKH